MVLSRRQKKTLVSAGSRSTTSGGGARTPNVLRVREAGKRKGNELANSCDSSEPAKMRLAPSAGSAPLPATFTVTGGQAASCRWQLVRAVREITYAALIFVTHRPVQPSVSLKPTNMCSDPSEPTVSSKITNTRMSSDMSVQLKTIRMTRTRKPK